MKEAQLKSLFLASLKGDQIAYSEFLREVTALLRAYLKRAMRNQKLDMEPEDLVQEVLISVHQKRELFDQQKAVLPWLYAIAKYRMIDAYRSKLRGPRLVEILETLEDGFSLEGEVSRLRGEEDGSELLEGLTDKQKEVLWMSKVEEVPLAEISENLGISHSLVKVTIHRTLKSLRERSKK